MRESDWWLLQVWRLWQVFVIESGGYGGYDERKREICDNGCMWHFP